MAAANKAWETLAHDTSLEDEVERLEKQITELREALSNIVKHHRIVGGAMSHLSTTIRIAEAALANMEPEDE